jgi:hypothetical protein
MKFLGKMVPGNYLEIPRDYLISNLYLLSNAGSPSVSRSS